jgi:hypothetical protein
MDESPLLSNNYYRLKQLDFDGNFSFSNITVVNFEENNALDLYPNLENDKITIRTKVKEDSESTIQLISFSDGKLMLQTSLSPYETALEMDISFLPVGSYIARLVNGYKVFIRKFIKQ